MELSSGKAVVDIQPQFDEIRNYSGNGLIITGRADHGSEFDFLTRFFCPKLGIDEVILSRFRIIHITVSVELILSQCLYNKNNLMICILI